jgi:hypothetical protein
MPVCCFLLALATLSPSTSSSHIGGHRHAPPQPQLAQNQTLQEKATFSDSSGPLFNMYNKMTEEEDNKMAQRWQKDADGILIFVSLYSCWSTAANMNIVDRFILGCCRDISRGLCSGFEA